MSRTTVADLEKRVAELETQQSLLKNAFDTLSAAYTSSVEAIREEYAKNKSVSADAGSDS